MAAQTAWPGGRPLASSDDEGKREAALRGRNGEKCFISIICPSVLTLNVSSALSYSTWPGLFSGCRIPGVARASLRWCVFVLRLLGGGGDGGLVRDVDPHDLEARGEVLRLDGGQGEGLEEAVLGVRGVGRAGGREDRGGGGPEQVLDQVGADAAGGGGDEDPGAGHGFSCAWLRGWGVLRLEVAVVSIIRAVGAARDSLEMACSEIVWAMEDEAEREIQSQGFGTQANAEGACTRCQIICILSNWGFSTQASVEDIMTLK
ncbi:uncharacterized protein ColSpa_02659 [Colletotrichum spaethianum]|uniref:Uncharacterized protein n=1 Tax=Colletotrichum spaethianum TaxID=700344 RepID=A0AA37L5X9_9PEZI|nr:uncharacterized protein ColSpa_02659 [Colletotrichum spaethianum]GKT42478.1 hypothetical protein ColSpa_02659 [Colletotrichum spaethianum]